MLETLDLDLKLGKKDYKEARERLGQQLSLLQRAAYENGIPAMFVFEGWDGAGKGDAIGRLVEFMDPRGFKVHTPRMEVSEDEALRPLLWRFWRLAPGKGEVAILDRSWYFILTSLRLADEFSHLDWKLAMEGVKDFERQLAADGTVLIKFWLHISRKEQKRRIKAWGNDPYQQWRAQRAGRKTSERHREILDLTEETMALTHAHGAPWIPVAAEDNNHRRIKVLEHTVAAFRHALESRGVPLPTPDAPGTDATPGPYEVVPHPDPLVEVPPIPPDSPLGRADLSLGIDPDVYKQELRESQARIRELGFGLYAKRRAAVIVFEGWDAGGKGGAIKRLTERLDPRGYDVLPYAAPECDEANHHYLWRFWRGIPKAGHLAIFDRSWYGRVMVERVEGFASEDAWRRAYQEINEFERTLTDAGIVMVKFWLHISPEEQLARFRARESIPVKRHKINQEDWRNRAKYPQYLEAVNDMLRQTSTPNAPWTIVEGNSKHFARVKVLNTVIQALEPVAENGD